MYATVYLLATAPKSDVFRLVAAEVQSSYFIMVAIGMLAALTSS